MQEYLIDIIATYLLIPEKKGRARRDNALR
jgi:hypothetical protein